MRLLHPTDRCIPLHAMPVKAVSNGHPYYPEPNHVMHVKGTMFIRDDEADVILSKLRRVSANESHPCR